MVRASRLATLGFAVVALGGSVEPLAAQGAVSVDPALARRGQRLFAERGCAGCHSIGKGKRAGPDLAGVTERRELTWVRMFLKETDRMLEEDSIAVALLREYNNQRMKIPKLSDQEIDALINYIVQQTQRGGS
jgi:mono/diheme cytochrome c family protein